MVEAINGIGHVMGKQTIAESVESAAILDALRAIGVDYAQGFGIAPPGDFRPAPAGGARSRRAPRRRQGNEDPARIPGASRHPAD